MSADPVKLCDIAEIVAVKVEVSSLNNETYISTENMLPDRGGVASAASIPEKGKVNQFHVEDTLFSNIRTYFKKVWLADRKGGASPDVIIFRTKNDKRCSRLFLYYLISSDQFIDFTVLTAKGAKMPRGDKAAMEQFEFWLPSRGKQVRISEILKSLDDKIELSRQMNATLEEMAQVLFKRWFVDFEFPYDFENNRPDPNGQPYKSSGGKMVDSELGMIPKGWEVRKIETVLERLKAKKRYTKKQVQPYGGTPVYEQGAAVLLGFHNDEPGFNATPDDPAFIFGDHTCVTHLSCEPFDISQNVIPLKGNQLPTLWAYYAVRDKQTFQEYRRHWSELIVKLIVVPKGGVADLFAELVKIFILQKEAAAQKNKQLEQIRDTLLPKLLSGELDVSQIEIPEVGNG